MTFPVHKSQFGQTRTNAQYNLTTDFAKADGAYWPRRISQTFAPGACGWKLSIDAINHDYAQGQTN